MEPLRTKRARVGNQRGQDRNGRRTSLEHLHPDLIFSRIFSLLPVFALLNFKLVCKAWYRIFQQYSENRSKIMNVHLSPTMPNLLILGEDLLKVYIYDRVFGMTKIKSPIKNLRDRIERVLSCNGLLCVTSSSRNHRICIYNPLTTVHAVLPYQPLEKTVYYRHFGFGFHRGISEYKVVAITGTAVNNQVINCVEVFTVSKSHSWRSVTENPVAFFEGSSDVVVDGAIHWLCCERLDLVCARVILSFDMAEEKFHKVPTPALKIGYCSVLAVLGGNLALTDPQIAADHLDIWTMKNDGSWTRQFAFGPPGPFSGPVCQANKEDVVLLCNDKALYVYHREMMYSEPIETRSLKLGRFKALHYNPVLFSPL